MPKISNVKKRISVNLARQIEPLVKEYYKYIRIAELEGYKLSFRDKDVVSDLFFGIKEERENNIGKHSIAYGCKPRSSVNPEFALEFRTIEGFNNDFKIWLENMKYYATNSILDDPILQGYQNEFYNDFKIVDEDADEVSFNYNQQLMLSEYIENIVDNIDSIKNEKNESTINEIKNDFIELQDSVTNETKNGFMKKLSKIFAKSRKAGVKISNFVVGEFIKGFIKSGGSYAFNFVVNNADKLPEYMEKIGQFVAQLKS